MKKFKILLISLLSLSIFNSCEDYIAGEEINKASTISFAKSVYDYSIDQNNPIFPLEIFATTREAFDRVVTVEVVTGTTNTNSIAGDYSFSNSITIPAGEVKGVGNITFNHSALPLGVTRFVTFKIVQPEGTVTNISNNITKINYTPLCLYNLVDFSLILDRYGSEITWEIKQGANLIASGGPYTDTTTNALQPEIKSKFCLPAGSYTFKIFDVYGDGLYTSSSVQGSYKLKLGSTTLFQGSGNFGSSATHNFVLN